MKSLLFCTSYCSNDKIWKQRIEKWFNHHKQCGLEYDKLLIIDDGSPEIPVWDCITTYDSPFEEEPAENHVLIHFQKNLGRNSIHDYPGWFRSFSFAAKFAKKFNYDKIIHIESDAYVLSKNLIHYINNITDGWTTLWCPLHRYPETAIQIIGKDKINVLYNIVSGGYGPYKNKAIETCLPFTNINRQFKGDRYFEYTTDVPLDSDYSCQSDHITFDPTNFKI